jgi:hypothetical protein
MPGIFFGFGVHADELLFERKRFRIRGLDGLHGGGKCGKYSGINN